MTTERGMLEACPPEDRGCDPKMPRWELRRQSSAPLGSQPGTAPWRLCTCRGGVSRGRPGPLQRSGPSFSTRQTPVGLLASEMAYFSTVFKTEVTVSAQVTEAYKDPCFFIWCSDQWDGAARPRGGWWQSCGTLCPGSCRTGLGDPWSLL